MRSVDLKSWELLALSAYNKRETKPRRLSRRPSRPPRNAGSGGSRALAEHPGLTSSRGESVASSLARFAGEQPK